MDHTRREEDIKKYLISKNKNNNPYERPNYKKSLRV